MRRDTTIITKADQRWAKASEKRKLYRKGQDWRWCTQHESSRRVLAEVMEWAHLFVDITPGSAESHAMLGMRRLGLRVYTELVKIDPTLPARMAAELAQADIEDETLASKESHDYEEDDS